MKNYLKNRDRAMDWINSEKQDFAQGIAILKDAGFKPGVIGVLERHGSGRKDSDERLKYQIREFIRCYADPKAKEDTDVTLNVVDGKELTPDPIGDGKVPSMFSEGVEKKMEAGDYPEAIAGIIGVYRAAYVSRDKLLRILASLPETNNDATVLKRRKISDAMNELSDIMDKLYPQYAAYVNEGKVPEEFKAPALPDPEAFVDNEPANAAPAAPASNDSSDDNSDDSSDDGTSEPVVKVSKAELQKERKSIVTKIGRARNMLLYQKETKQEQKNPLTDPKKVAKYQAKIDRLTGELHDIDMQIAALA